MTRSLLESSERAEGYHCRSCGGPLVWLHERRFDERLGEATYGRAYVEYRDRRQRTAADREDVLPGGGRVYVRRLELICPRCHVISSRQQAGQGDPRPGWQQSRMGGVG